MLIRLILFSACLLHGMCVDACAQQPVADIEITNRNFAKWRDHIMPEESELAFYRIPWERTFQDGILKADEQDKPVLLWTMNGHPLGCT